MTEENSPQWISAENLPKNQRVRKGDTIRVVQPYTFVSAGYKNKYDRSFHLTEDIVTPLCSFISERFNITIDGFFRSCLSGIARMIRNRQTNFGGGERGIFVSHNLSVEDSEFIIESVLHVDCGTWVAKPEHGGMLTNRRRIEIVQTPVGRFLSAHCARIKCATNEE